MEEGNVDGGGAEGESGGSSGAGSGNVNDGISLAIGLLTPSKVSLVSLLGAGTTISGNTKGISSAVFAPPDRFEGSFSGAGDFLELLSSLGDFSRSFGKGFDSVTRGLSLGEPMVFEPDDLEPSVFDPPAPRDSRLRCR